MESIMPTRMIDANKFKTGLKWMDAQHIELVNMTVDLLNSIEQEKSEHNIKDLLKFLERYVSGHFLVEKQQQEIYDYPEKDSHLAEHAIFEDTFLDLKAEFRSKGSSPYFSGKVKRHLLDWLVNHIGGADKKLAQFLLDKGLSPDADEPALGAVAKSSVPHEQKLDFEKRYC